MKINWDKHWNYIKRDGNASLQWKGTAVCIDIWCPKCKYQTHLDVEFLYYYKCPKCKTIYSLSPVIELIELPKEHVEFILKDRPNLIRTENEDDYCCELQKNEIEE